MRIGIDIRALIEGKTTGVEVYIVNLLNALFRLDQANEYILFTTNFRNKEFDKSKFDFPNVTIKTFRYPNKIFNFSQKYLRFPKVDKLLSGIDLFFSPHWRLVALSQNVPLVMTFHDLSFEIFPEFFTLRQRFWHKFMNHRKAGTMAEAVIAVSENTKQDLMKIYNIQQEKIHVIHSGVSLASAEKKPEQTLLPEKFFLSFGTLEPRKNLSGVLAAYDEYLKLSKNPLPLVIAGATGWKSDFENLPSAVKKNLTVLYGVTEEEKSYLYRHAFALLALSFYEGFGFPILEAALSGVPVIASSSTSLAEIGKDFALLVNPFRSDQVAKAMLEVQEDQMLYNKLKGQGLSVAEKYKWEETAAQTLKLFENTCA